MKTDDADSNRKPSNGLTTKDVTERSVAAAHTRAPGNRLLVGVIRRTGETFASLAHRDYAMILAGAFVSNTGTWIQAVALSWLVLEMTDSAFYVGLLQFTTSVPVFLFAFLAGVVADRTSRRSLLVYSMSIAAVFAFVLAALVDMDRHTIGLIMVITFGSGIAVAFAYPAWIAMISDLVPRRDLLNAIALNSAQFHTARMIGPAVAGFLIATLGMAAAFYINAVSYAAVIIVLLLISYTHHAREEKRSWWREFVEGVGYAWRTDYVRRLLLAVGALTIFGLSFIMVLAPVVARDVLGVGEQGYGILLGANGLGALVGALGVAAYARSVRPRLLIGTGMLLYGAAMVIVGTSTTFFVSTMLMFVAGVAFLAVMSTLNTQVQATVPDAIRGRVMSIFVWLFMGLVPFGSILAGALAEWLGTGAAMATGSAVLVVLGIAILSTMKRVKTSD